MKRLTVFALLALALLAGSPAHAAFVIGGTEGGWQLTTDGLVNAFLVYESGDDRPDNVVGGTLSDDAESFRVRTGLLPGILAFNVKAPPVDGYNMAARVGFYPQINNANTRNSFNGQIDLREIFFTVDGDFGQFLAGKTLNLFQGRNILTDMTLYGAGVQGGVSGGGTTLGRIGYGYIYAQFGAQMRYTTPDFSGFKLAVSVVDPSKIAGSGLAATQTKAPDIEAELSYSTKLSSGQVTAWVSGLYQKATFKNTGTSLDGDDVTASGVAGGVQTIFGPVDVVVSGFTGQGLGSTLMLDTDSLDPAGEERDSWGFLAQAGYTFAGRTKVALSYGQNELDETSAEKDIRTLNGTAELEKQSSWTAGVYHDITKHWKIMGEYTLAKNEWFGGSDQDSNIVALGTFFIW
jgi:hypothetical protein